MIQNFEYLIVFISASGVLPEQNDRYRIQPWKVNEIKAYKKVLQGSAYFRIGTLLISYQFCSVQSYMVKVVDQPRFVFVAGQKVILPCTSSAA